MTLYEPFPRSGKGAQAREVRRAIRHGPGARVSAFPSATGPCRIGRRRPSPALCATSPA